jgi:arylsulfatase A-like enzyme
MIGFLRSRWLPFAAAAVLLVLLAAQFVQVRVPSRPVRGIEALRELRDREDLNVVFIVIDTLRADRLSAYGYARPTSPTLDDLASSAVRFAHVQAQSSWTKTSMASLWTGTYPGRNGVLRYPDAIPDSRTLPAEILKAAGYDTVGLYRNGWVANNFGFAQGFDVYTTPARRPDSVSRANPSGGHLPGSDFDVSESAVEFLRASGGRRTFVYLHYMDVHQYVFDDQSSLFGTTFSDSYDNAIHWVDRNVRHVLQQLDDAKLLEKTIVVIAADHGEAFSEHGIEGHGKQLYREVVETPLLLVLPFRFDRAVVVDEPVENVDVWPTLLDLLGLPALPDAQGRSLLPAIEAAYRGERAPAGADRVRVSHIDRTWGRVEGEPNPLVRLSRGDWRFHFGPSSDPQQVELYDAAEDPGEQRNVAAEQPAAVADLRAEAERYLADQPAEGRAEVREIDEMRLLQLRALGYVVR